MEFVSAVRKVLEPKATLVLMHGLGSDEQDMRGLADLLHPNLEVICLRAPLRYGPGFAWFEIQWTNAGIQIDEDQYWQSVEGVAGLLQGIQTEKLLVGGFSQGAMMSVGILDRHPDLVKGAVLLSGRGISDAPCQFDGNVFQAHGAFDDVIPFDSAQILRKRFDGFGPRYEFHEYEMGHSVCQEEIDDLNRWLVRILVD